MSFLTSTHLPVTIADMKATPVREQFLEMIARPDADIDLVAGALLIAKEEYPALDVTAYHSRLDRLAEQTRPRLKGLDGNPFAVIDALNTCLFAEEGFRGDTEQYFDPRNSFLNDVLDRKRGIPITLSVISIEVAARLGYSMRGVGFPGHFIVRHATEGREILIDPFHQGEILMLDDCRGLLKAVFGSELPFDMRYLAPVSKRQILTRMLGNLKAIYMKADDYPRALRVIDRLVALAPEDTGLLRDRGYSNLNLCHFERAVNDLEAYLSSWPAAADARAVRKQITSIRRFSASLN